VSFSWDKYREFWTRFALDTLCLWTRPAGFGLISFDDRNGFQIMDLIQLLKWTRLLSKGAAVSQAQRVYSPQGVSQAQRVSPREGWQRHPFAAQRSGAAKDIAYSPTAPRS